jgi:hypothetical protein
MVGLYSRRMLEGLPRFPRTRLQMCAPAVHASVRNRGNLSFCNKTIRRFSSAVEQRFCKPKVGSSILSTGTSKIT